TDGPRLVANPMLPIPETTSPAHKWRAGKPWSCGRSPCAGRRGLHREATPRVGSGEADQQFMHQGPLARRQAVGIMLKGGAQSDGGRFSPPSGLDAGGLSSVGSEHSRQDGLAHATREEMVALHFR